jgi:hypothetical protein
MFRSTCSAILRRRLVCLHQFRAAGFESNDVEFNDSIGI